MRDKVLFSIVRYYNDTHKILFMDKDFFCLQKIIVTFHWSNTEH